MPQIDVMLKFATRAAALADPVVAQYLSKDDQGQDQFQTNDVLPNMRLWRASQDINGVHTYLTGYYILVSLPQTIPSLRDHSAIQVAADRDKMNARQAGMILRTAIPMGTLQDIRFEPVFAGMDPPWGAWR
jgi:hypothetical protein